MMKQFMNYKEKMEKQGTGVTEALMTDIIKTISSEHSPMRADLKAAEEYRQQFTMRQPSEQII